MGGNGGIWREGRVQAVLPFLIDLISWWGSGQVLEEPGQLEKLAEATFREDNLPRGLEVSILSSWGRRGLERAIGAVAPLPRCIPDTEGAPPSGPGTR